MGSYEIGGEGVSIWRPKGADFVQPPPLWVFMTPSLNNKLLDSAALKHLISNQKNSTN